MRKINIMLVTKDRICSTYVAPVEIGFEDDGTLTLVVEAWPERDRDQEILEHRQLVKLARDTYLEENSDGVHDCPTPYDIYPIQKRENVIDDIWKSVNCPGCQDIGCDNCHKFGA